MKDVSSEGSFCICKAADSESNSAAEVMPQEPTGTWNHDETEDIRNLNNGGSQTEVTGTWDREEVIQGNHHNEDATGAELQGDYLDHDEHEDDGSFGDMWDFDEGNNHEDYDYDDEWEVLTLHGRRVRVPRSSTAHVNAAPNRRHRGNQKGPKGQPGPYRYRHSWNKQSDRLAARQTPLKPHTTFGLVQRPDHSVHTQWMKPLLTFLAHDAHNVIPSQTRGGFLQRSRVVKATDSRRVGKTTDGRPCACPH